ncbi:hypothetical protein Mgra_00008100 [Meloidogyne graminicola]|nr:hypothetical protein Mgra_00008100 [Meloidogyne graminicola]
MINFEEIRKIHISAENHCFVITSNFQKILDENNTIQSKYQNLYNEEYLNYLKLLTDGNISVEMKAPDNIFNYIYNIGEKDFCKKEEEFNDDVDTLPNRRKASGVKKVRKTSWGQRHSSFNRELKKEIENELNYLNENMDILWEKIARKIIYLQYFYQDLIRAILLCERIEKHHQKHEKTSLGIGTSAGQPSPKTSKEYDSLMIKLNHLKVKPVMMYFIISHRKGFPSDHSGVALAEILRKEKDKLYKTANYASFMELYGITTYEGVYHYEGPEFYNNQLKVYFNFIFGSYKPKFVQVEVKRKNKIEISESATGASSNIVSGRESRRSSGHIKFEPSSQSSEKHSEIHSETDEEKIEVEKDEEDYSDFDGDDSNEEYDDQGQKQVQQIGQSGVPPFYQQPSQYYNPQDIPGSSTGYYHYPPDFQH